MSRSPLPDPVEAVTLDVGGVLTLPPVVELLAAHGLHPTPLEILVAHHTAVAVEDRLLATRSDAEDGLGPERGAYHRAFAVAVGAGDDVAVVLAEDLHGLARRELPWGLAAPWASETVAALTSGGVPVAIVSNSDGTVEAQLVEMAVCQVGPGPLPQVVCVVDSAVVGARKPDPAIFSPALEALGSEPAQTVHVGDTVAFDVAAA